MSNSVIEKYAAAYAWVNNPPAGAPASETELEHSGLAIADVAEDFDELLAQVRKLSAKGRGRELASGRIKNLERYIGGGLREDVPGPLVAVACSDPSFGELDDVDLVAPAAAVWRSNVITWLIDQALPEPVSRAGHQVGCVTATYDADSNALELNVRLVRRGAVSLTCGISQSLGVLETPPAWVDQLRIAGAELARSGAMEDPARAEPARPGEGGEPSDLAIAVAKAMSAGATELQLYPDEVAAGLTRQDLADASGEAIAATEVTFTENSGALLIWQPGEQTPTTIALVG